MAATLRVQEREFLIAEYQALRTEISERLARSFRITLQGLFGVPAIVAVGKLAENELQIGAPFFLLAPLVVVISCFLYVAEHSGVMRVGGYIRSKIEPQIAPGEVGWENWLGENSEQLHTRKVDKYVVNCFFAVAVLYFVGSLLAFFFFAGPLFELNIEILGFPLVNLAVAAIYSIGGVVLLYVAFKEAHVAYSFEAKKILKGRNKPRC